MRARLIVATALALSLALSACSNGPESSDPNNPQQVEVLTWMTTGSGLNGFARAVSVFQSAQPDLHLLDASVAGGHDAARAAVLARLDADTPPDSFQSRAGAELRDYALSGALRDLDGLFDEPGLADAFPQELLDQLSVAGHVYAVPLSLQRSNVLWSNSAVLQDAGVAPRTPAADIPAWLHDLRAIRSAGMQYPLAVGGPSHQLALFESVLLAELGLERYDGLWNGQTRWDGEAVARAVATYDELIGFADPDRSRAHDDDILSSLVAGQAAYLVAPSSSDAAFGALEWRYGVDYTASAVPGTSGVFAFAADTFTLPAGASHPDAATAWLRFVGSADGQAAFTSSGGGIPARTGVPVDTPYQKAAESNLDLSHLAPSLSLGTAADGAWTAAIQDAVVAFQHDDRPAALVTALAAAADAALGTP
jgi:glucose/mannose transport system substrate-binding protein